MQIVGSVVVFSTAIIIDYKVGKWQSNMESRAAWMRTEVEDQGPTFIKMAQQLSTRTDVIPEKYLVQLRALQVREDIYPQFSEELENL